MRLVGASNPRRSTIGLWFSALAISCGLHGACLAYVAWRDRQSAEDDALGAAVMEIGIDLASPHDEEADLPPGPEAEASAASSASVRQTAKVEDVEAPKEKPIDTADAERLVSPEVNQDAKTETPKLEEPKADAAPEAVASEATAAPKLETAREAPRATALAIGSGANARLVRTTWQKQLNAHLRRFKRHPGGSAKYPVTIIVGFTLDRFGHVLSATVVRGSGDPAFDRAALAMMSMASPVPPPPPSVADEGLTFSMPVIFRDAKH